MKKILCVGAAVVDFIFHLDELPNTAEKFGTESASIVGGGCAANAAVAIARLGGHPVLAAQLGQDVIGDMILSQLRDEGVDVSQVSRTSSGQSSYSSIYINSRGDRQIVNFRGRNLSLATDWFANLGSIDAVLTDTRRVQAAIEALKLARSLDIPAIVDCEAPIDPAIMPLASHLAFSMQGLESLMPGQSPEDSLISIAGKYNCWACVTDGANGTWFTQSARLDQLDSCRHLPAYKVQVRDTLAAGDIWHGAFALALAEGQEEAQAVDFANAAAAIKCMTAGGRSGAPNRHQLENFIKGENT